MKSACRKFNDSNFSFFAGVKLKMEWSFFILLFNECEDIFDSGLFSWKQSARQLRWNDLLKSYLRTAFHIQIAFFWNTILLKLLEKYKSNYIVFAGVDECVFALSKFTRFVTFLKCYILQRRPKWSKVNGAGKIYSCFENVCAFKIKPTCHWKKANQLLKENFPYFDGSCMKRVGNILEKIQHAISHIH